MLILKELLQNTPEHLSPHVVLGSLPETGPYVIYGLFDKADPDHIRYIGYSCEPKARFAFHVRAARLERELGHKSNWIRKVLRRGGSIDWRPLRFAESRSEAAFIEQPFIRGFRLAGHRLTNETGGGDGGALMLPSVLKRNREAHLKYWRERGRTPEQLAKLSASIAAWWAERRRNPEEFEKHCRKMSAAKKGICPKLTPEQLKAMSDRMSRQVRTDKQKARQSEYKREWWAARKAGIA